MIIILPKEIILFDRKFKIKEIDIEDYNGEIRVNKNEIVIRNNMCDDEKIVTLIHEIMHSFFIESAYEHLINDKTCEYLCDMLAYQLKRFIKNNNINFK